jgi:hypothetical protein
MSLLQREPFLRYANQLHFPHWECEKRSVMKRILYPRGAHEHPDLRAGRLLLQSIGRNWLSEYIRTIYLVSRALLAPCDGPIQPPLDTENVSVEIHREAPNESLGRILENTLRSTARALPVALWLMLFWRGRVCDMMSARGLLALQLMAEQLGEGHSMTKLLWGFSPGRSVWRRIDDGR